MKLPTPLLVTDLDGTLANTMDVVLEQIWDATGVAITPEDCHEYDVAQSFLPRLEHKLDLQALRHCLQVHVWTNPKVYRQAKPYWSVHQAYQAWIHAGGAFAVMTSRPTEEGVKETTLDWLQYWGYGGASCYFSCSYQKGKEDILDELIQQLDWGQGVLPELWVAEDQPDAAKRLAEVLQFARGDCGVQGQVYLMNRPWTQKALLDNAFNPCLEQDIMDRIIGVEEVS